MRYLTVILLLAFAVSCKKSSSSQTPASSLPTFQFTANGTVYQMNGDLADSLLGAKFIRDIGSTCSPSADTVYWLEATDSAGDGFAFTTGPASSISVTTYTVTGNRIQTGANSFCSYSGQATLKNLSPDYYAFQSQADYSTIVVTSVHNGLADGTFTGHLVSDVGNPAPTISITDGQFKNIKIVN